MIYINPWFAPLYILSFAIGCLCSYILLLWINEKLFPKEKVMKDGQKEKKYVNKRSKRSY